jgi:hypothetical protein
MSAHKKLVEKLEGLEIYVHGNKKLDLFLKRINLQNS